MSLVAYDASSDEDSDGDECKHQPTANVPKQQSQRDLPSATIATNGHISDDEDDYMLGPTEELSKSCTFTMALPKPTKEATIQDILKSIPTPPFHALPTPKPVSSEIITEEDDEFLHKKDSFVTTETKPLPKVVTKIPVKISIPSLEEFRDVQKDMGTKGKSINAGAGKNSSSAGLLGLLPQAKSERNFSKTEKTAEDYAEKTAAKSVVKTRTPAFIPDTVKYGRSAYSTEEFGGSQVTKKTNHQKDKPKLVTCSDSEPSDEEDTKTDGDNDFFSLTNDDHLPEVSANEISAMVAKKTAKMAEFTNKYLAEAESNAAKETNVAQSNLHELEMARKRYQEQQLDSEVVQALVGSSAKRRRHQKEVINIVDINSEEILPNRDEWMRTALASSTVYQPTGVLVDEEPAAGTRRKHQITYLAHKAKANEAELQAIWAANRQTRRATQSKYGF